MRMKSHTKLLRYQFIDEESFWCPTLDFSRFVRPDNLKKVVFGKYLISNEGEEFLHRHSFIKTKLRLQLAWEEALSNCVASKILDMSYDFSQKDNNFQLLVPLKYNLKVSKVPISLKIQIKDLENACRIISHLGEICRPFLESFVLAYQNMALDKMVLEKLLPQHKAKIVFKQLKQAKFRKYSYLRYIYPKLEKSLSNMKFDEWLTHFLQCLFSPRHSGNVPPLLLQDSFIEFNEKYIFNVKKRLFKFLNKVRNPILSLQRFLEFTKENNLEYMDGEQMNEVFTAYEISCEFFSEELKKNFVVIEVPMHTIKLSDRFHVFTYIDTEDVVLKFLRTSIAPIFVCQTEKGEAQTHFSRGLDNKTAQKMYHAAGVTSLKYFLLNPSNWYCPFIGTDEACNSCFIENLRKKGRLKIHSFACPVGETFPIEGVNMKFVH